jgi:hypothetical protein
MKKEDAIIKVEMMDNYLSHTCQDYGESNHEAMMMAIEALEQQSEDAISRAEVLSIYDEWFATCDISNKKASPKAKIKALPPVTPKAKTAHWIVEKGKYLGMKNGYCSNCKNYYTNYWYEMKYCPNCGADMREVEE